MKALSYQKKPRSIGAQISRMKRWPSFEICEQSPNHVIWRGSLRGFQLVYSVGIIWQADGSMDRPHVWLISPKLRPREGGTFKEIPHLMYNGENPERSGLCLFDPDAKEWGSNMLIADTTVPWAAAWLRYYELWHYDGMWRGGGVGPESVAEMEAVNVCR